MKTLPEGTVFYRMGANGGCIDGLDGPYRVTHTDSEHIDLWYYTIGPQYFAKGFYAYAQPELDYEQFCISNMGTREGLFEKDAKYLVMEPVDVAMLVHNLTLPGGEPNESRVRVPADLELP